MSVVASTGTVESPVLRDARHHGARAYAEVATWLDALELENKAPRTIEAYLQTAAFLLRAQPGKTLTEMTSGDVMQVLKAFPPGARHIRRYQLNLLFEWAYLNRLVEENPMRRVPKVQRPGRKVKPTFTDAERMLLEGLPAPDGPLMSLLFRTGVRLEEAIQLQAKHAQFDLDRSRLIVRKGKGGKGRVIPMRDLAPILADWFRVDAIGDDDFLWYTRPAGRVIRRREMPSKGTFYNWWRESLHAAQVDTDDATGHRTVHSTRHSFATNYIKRGGRLDRLSLILGHASIATTMSEYVHLDFEDVYADLELVEG